MEKKTIIFLLATIVCVQIYNSISYNEKLNQSQLEYIKNLNTITNEFIVSMSKVNSSLESMDRRLIKLESTK